MSLQRINWTQVDTENVPSGSSIDLGSPSGSLHAVYADNLYISGTSVTALIAAGGGTGGTGGTNGSSGTSGSSGVGSSGSSGTSGVNGTSGSSGTNGSSGTSGIGTDGTSGTSGYVGYEGHLAIWRYSGNTNTALDPGVGYFNLDSAAWGTSTTSITLDNVAYSPNTNFSAYLDSLTIGTILKLVKVGDTSTFKLLKIDLVSPFDSGYEKYTVSELSGDGTTPNDNDEFLTAHAYSLTDQKSRNAVVGCLISGHQGHSGPAVYWQGVFANRNAFISYLHEAHIWLFDEIERLPASYFLSLWKYSKKPGVKRPRRYR